MPALLSRKFECVLPSLLKIGAMFDQFGALATHCDVLFHKDCAERHFKDDNVLTEEMIVEIERRAALANAAPAQVESGE